MAYFLRFIYKNLDWDKTHFSSWLKEDELPACIIKDLRADGNALSLWEISDDKSNLLDVIAAFAFESRGDIKNDWNFALLRSNYLDEVNFAPSDIPAKTAYTSMNRYHHSFPKLSISKVVYFAHLLRKHGKFDTKSWKEIEARLTEVNSKGQLNKKMLKSPKLKARLGIA